MISIGGTVLSVRTVKRFFGIFVLAFLILFIVIIIKLPQSDDIVIDDDDFLLPDNTVETDPVVDPVIDEPAEEPDDEPDDEPVVPFIEAVSLNDEQMPDNLQKLAQDYKAIGMSVVVIENGEVTHSYVYGKQDRGDYGTDPVAFTSDTIIRVAGVSELVSAVGVMSLCEQGLLSLDAPIGDFLGYTVKNPKTDSVITLRQLMTHSAGMSDYGDYNNVVYGKIKHQTLKQLLTGDNAKSNFYSYKSGYEYDFSNFGSAMIGCIVSAVTGQSFDSYMKSTVFEPLAIDAAFSSTGITNRSNIATIYRQNEVNYTLEEMDEFAAELSSVADVDNYRISHGNLYISAAGLSRIAQLFLENGSIGLVSVISEDSVDQMLSTEAVGSLYKNVGTGLCVSVKTDLVPGRTLYGHGGSAYGATAEIFFDPTDKSGVVIICNGSLNTTDDTGFSLMAKAFIKEIYSSVIGD